MDLRVREWSQLKYLDPEVILRGLYRIASTYATSELPYEVASLRRRDLRREGEGRQAALFCYGISKRFGVPVEFAQVQRSDYDVVSRYLSSNRDELVYAPIQLKELVPARVNANALLQEELDKLSKYADSKDLVVAFHINRAQEVRLSELHFPHGKVRELWFYGSTGSPLHWVIIGNLLNDKAVYHEFTYPAA